MSVRPSIPHVPALDGIRGLGVAGILLFHAGHLPGGWLGVDLFFVLSGFLITTLLLVEYEAAGQISVASFWGRRARRLFPALLGMLLGVALYAALVAAPEELPRIRADGVATLLYVANWHAIVAEQNYWNLFAAPSPLHHTWSLAIEEQFYLLWPLCTLLLLRVLGGSARALALASLLLAGASALAMALLYNEATGTSRAYFGTDTRASAILLGSALAAWQRAQGPAGPRAGAALRLAAVAAAAGLAWAWAALDGRAPFVYRGGLLLTQLAGTLLIAAVLVPGTHAVGRVLGARPLRGLGIVSYGLYLWHWPVYVSLSPQRVGLDGWTLTALRLAVSAALAIASYFLLERPIRRGAFRPAQALGLGAAAAVGVSALLLVVTQVPAGPTPLVLPAGGPGSDPSGRTIFVLGDSVAGSFAPFFKRLAPTWGTYPQTRAGIGCITLEGDDIRFRGGTVLEADWCKEQRAQWFEWVASSKPDLVLLVEGWPGLGDRRLDGVWVHPCDPAYDAAYASDLTAAIRRLSADAGAVAVVTTPPVDVMAASDLVVGGPGVDRADLAPLAAERMACQNRVRRRVAEATGASVIDLAGFLCPGGPCRRELDGAPVRPDGVHFQGPAGQQVTEWLLQQIAPAPRPPNP